MNSFFRLFSLTFLGGGFLLLYCLYRIGAYSDHSGYTKLLMSLSILLLISSFFFYWCGWSEASQEKAKEKQRKILEGKRVKVNELKAKYPNAIKEILYGEKSNTDIDELNIDEKEFDKLLSESKTKLQSLEDEIIHRKNEELIKIIRKKYPLAIAKTYRGRRLYKAEKEYILSHISRFEQKEETIRLQIIDLLEKYPLASYYLFCNGVSAHKWTEKTFPCNINDLDVQESLYLLDKKSELPFLESKLKSDEFGNEHIYIANEIRLKNNYPIGYRTLCERFRKRDSLIEFCKHVCDNEQQIIEIQKNHSDKIKEERKKQRLARLDCKEEEEDAPIKNRINRIKANPSDYEFRLRGAQSFLESLTRPDRYSLVSKKELEERKKEREKLEKERLEREKKEAKLKAEIERRNELASQFKYFNLGGHNAAYYFDYYPKNRYPNVSVVDESNRRALWHFKDGFYSFGLNALEDFLDGNFTKEEMKNLTICVIPASTQYKNDCRYKTLCSKIADKFPINNGYNYISIAYDRSDSREQKSMNTISNLIFSSEVCGKRIILFDDITTRGTSFIQVAEQLEAKGAIDIYGFFLGKTI